jgi:hypothetical protein
MAMRSDLSNYDVYGQLWLAVLALAVEDACMDLQDEIPDSSTGARTVRTYTENQWLQRRARLWLDSRESSVGSMEWICTLLNLKPEAIRDEYKRRSNGDHDRRSPDRVSVYERED